MTGFDGNFRNNIGLCDAGKCYVVDVANSCKAICGKYPCPECKDLKPGGMSCEMMKGMGWCESNDPSIKELVATRCQVTCGFCPKKL